MSSINNNTQTPSPKSVSAGKKEASIEKTSVNSSQTSIADATSPSDTIAKTTNTESLSPTGSKRRSITNSGQGSGDEGSGTESLASSKRRKIQPDNKTSSPHLSGPRGLIAYKGVGLTSGRTGLAVAKSSEIEQHVYLDPADTTSFPAVSQETSTTCASTPPSAPVDTATSVVSAEKPQAAEPSALVTSSSPIVSPVATPASTANGEDDGSSALPLSRSSLPFNEAGTPVYFSMATKEALSSHFTVDRLADLNEMIRNVVATKPDNNTAMVLNRDMADVLLYKDLLIKEANKHLSKVEEDYQVTLDQLFFSNDAKSDLIDKARAETDRVRAELAVHTELEEKKLRYHNLWSPQDASWSQRKQCQEQISELEGELTEARDRIQAWKGVFRDNSQTIGELRLREKELLKGPSASMVEGDKTQKQLDASRGEIKRLMELQAANKAEYRSLVEKLKAQNEVTKRQLDASLERAGGYHDLQSANNSQKQELASLKEENRRMKLSLQLHADAQKVNVTRFASLKEMLKVKGDEYDALQVDFDRLKDEHGRCGDTHQRLQTQLDQGRQWANSVVNNCPFDLDRVVAAESARDLANSLRVIAELEFQVLQQDNTYRQPRSMVPNPADDVLPSVESHPVQVESQARVLSSPSQGPTRSVSPHAQAYQEYQSNVERKQVLNAAAAKESFDANQAFSETSSDYQMDNDYFEDDLRRKAVIPVLITRNTTVPFPPFDNDLSTRLLADINQQDQAEEPEDDDSNLDEPHPVSIKVEYQEDTDELPDYEDYQPIDNAGVRPASPRIKSEELSANIAAESYLNNLHGYNPNAFGGRYAPAQTDGYLDPNPDVLSDDDDDDEPLLPGGGCSHRRVFADGTCASCGNKLPRHREDTPPEAPRPVQTGFRQARQAHQARQALQALQALQAPPTVAVPVQTGFRQVRQALQALQARQARQASPTVAVPGQTGFRQVRQALQARQARQASPAVAVPVINNKQSARLEKECYSSMFGGKCGGIGCTCNLTRNPLPEVSSTGPPAGDTTEAACPHNIQFMGICSICGKDVSAVAPRAIPRAVPRAVPRTLSPSPPPASSRSPPSKKRGRFVDDSDSDSDSFDGGFRPTKKAKTVATPPERSQSPGVAPFEHDPTDFAPPSEHDNSGSDAPGPSDGDAAN